MKHKHIRSIGLEKDMQYLVGGVPKRAPLAEGPAAGSAIDPYLIRFAVKKIVDDFDRQCNTRSVELLKKHATGDDFVALLESCRPTVYSPYHQVCVEIGDAIAAREGKEFLHKLSLYMGNCIRLIEYFEEGFGSRDINRLQVPEILIAKILCNIAERESNSDVLEFMQRRLEYRFNHQIHDEHSGAVSLIANALIKIGTPECFPLIVCAGKHHGIVREKCVQFLLSVAGSEDINLRTDACSRLAEIAMQ